LFELNRICTQDGWIRGKEAYLIEFAKVRGEIWKHELLERASDGFNGRKKEEK